jgi:L-iditol 2-dehydrogenase
VGNASADVTVKKEVYAQILRKQLTFFGSWNSDFSTAVNDWTDSVRAVAEGRIEPEKLITHKFPLREGERAFAVAKNKEFYNKIMVVTE